jgi:hypothetical protein
VQAFVVAILHFLDRLLPGHARRQEARAQTRARKLRRIMAAMLMRSEGEFQVAELDWIALQRLKALGLVEERSTASGDHTEGSRVVRALIAKS